MAELLPSEVMPSGSSIDSRAFVRVVMLTFKTVRCRRHKIGGGSPVSCCRGENCCDCLSSDWVGADLLLLSASDRVVSVVGAVDCASWGCRGVIRVGASVDEGPVLGVGVDGNGCIGG